MYAVVRTGGKQYKVEPGTKFVVEKLEAKKGSSVNLDDVLLVVDDKGEPIVGTPKVQDAKVTCEVLSQAKSKKIIVFKFKRRKRYKRKKGHRQELTMLKVNDVKCGDKVWNAKKGESK
jgi:large subunit ribosomal protein L21